MPPPRATTTVHLLRASSTLPNDAQSSKPLAFDDDIGPVLAMDGDELRGIVTERDITIRAVAEGVTYHAGFGGRFPIGDDGLAR